MATIKDSNPAELSELVNEFKTSSLLLMHRMLGSLSPGSVKVLAQLQNQGWRTAMEISLDQAGAWVVTMTAVNSSGVRKPIADVAQI
jgi:hypothetical protein